MTVDWLIDFNTGQLNGGFCTRPAFPPRKLFTWRVRESGRAQRAAYDSRRHLSRRYCVKWMTLRQEMAIG
ncbi:hypothetical protein BaRGS_00034548 [Batillaria attramentaria]|uniref:Uncharacterized protein n=1 Tax=Batillaria attramentaria TaxID=370345 RepID=A0ABD0JH04_9CAEN